MFKVKNMALLGLVLGIGHFPIQSMDVGSVTSKIKKYIGNRYAVGAAAIVATGLVVYRLKHSYDDIKDMSLKGPEIKLEAEKSPKRSEDSAQNQSMCAQEIIVETVPVATKPKPKPDVIKAFTYNWYNGVYSGKSLEDAKREFFGKDAEKTYDLNFTIVSKEEFEKATKLKRATQSSLKELPEDLKIVFRNNFADGNFGTLSKKEAQERFFADKKSYHNIYFD